MESGLKGERQKVFVIYLIDWGIFAVGLFLIFTNFKVTSRQGLIWTSVFALLAVLYYLVLYKMFLGRTKIAAAVHFLLNAGIVFSVAFAFGGLSTHYFPLYFTALLILGIYTAHYSLVISLAGILLILLPGFSAGNWPALLRDQLPELASLAGIFPISMLLGRQLLAIENERKRASFLAEHMTQEKSRDEALLASIADAVYAVDREKRVIMWNAAAEQLTGIRAVDILGLKDYDVIDLRDPKGKKVCPGSTCPIDEAWATNVPVRRDDLILTGKNTKTIALNYNAAPIKDLHNIVTGAVVIFQDITRRKEVDRMRNEFISVASHEMRTPIAAAEGYISLAQKIGGNDIPQKIGEYLKKAHSSVISSANLLKNLLLVSKIDEDALPIEPTIFSLNEMLTEAVTTLMPIAEAKKLTLTAEIPPGEFKIEADQERIKEVVTNLIENGIKFTKTGGAVITLSGNAEFVTACVIDTGPGITAAEIPKLFQKFYRVDNTFTREVGGTGLGLYLSKNIIERSNGKIWVESEEGKGSKFCFTLPRVK